MVASLQASSLEPDEVGLAVGDYPVRPPSPANAVRIVHAKEGLSARRRDQVVGTAH